MPDETVSPEVNDVSLSSSLLLFVAALAPSQPFSVQGPGVNPGDFRVTTFASGLNNPLSMQKLSDGSLVVTTSPGQVLRFVDANNDGVADGPGQVVASGLPFLPTALRIAGDLALVHSSGNDLNVYRLGATPSDPFALIGTVDFDYTNRPGEHVSHALGVSPTPGQPGKYDVYTNLGAAANFAATPLNQTVTLNGMGFNNATMMSDSVNMLRLDNTGATPIFESVTQIANGVRNPAGFIVDPVTGDLYFSENGIDTPGNRGEAFSTDELNFLAAADIGGAVESYGFPNRYVEYRTGNTIDDGMGPAGMIDPLVDFLPLPDPATGAESEGPNEIAFAPELFPDVVNNGIFVGFHGENGQVGAANGENPLVYVDLDTMEYFHFISNTTPGIGHLDGLLSTADSLFLADLQGGTSGAIYQITAFTAIPEPSSLLLAGLGFAGLAAMRQRSRRRKLRNRA